MSDLTPMCLIRSDRRRQPPAWQWDCLTGEWSTTSPTRPLRRLHQEPPTQLWQRPLPMLDDPWQPFVDEEHPQVAARAITIPTVRRATGPGAGEIVVRLATALVETLDGKRSLSQLHSWLDQPSLSTTAGFQRQWKNHQVRLASVRIQHHTVNTAEVTLRLTIDHFSHPAALKVTRHQDRWLASDLVIG